MRLLAIDIHQQIADATGADAGAIDSFLHHWTNQNSYLRATLNCGPRTNLDGSDADKVQPAHKVHAIRELKAAK
jgi:sRNA-binding protein